MVNVSGSPSYALVLLTALLAVLGDSSATTRGAPRAMEEWWPRELAIHWSPFIFHGTHNNYDIPTRWDFDGNMWGHDNWEHAFNYINEFQASIYYTFQESDSHYFLTYLFFHPRDTKIFGGHENDWEGARITVQKDDSYWGSFSRLETMSHSGLHVTTAPYWVNGRPVVWVEARGHGTEVFNDGIFPDDCGGLGLWHTGRGAEVPDHCNDRDVSYELFPFEEILWLLRTQDTYGGPFANTSLWFNGAYFGGRFYDDDGCRSKPPWSWVDDDGRWFMEPQPAQYYIYNPFLNSESGAVRDCGA